MFEREPIQKLLKKKILMRINTKFWMCMDTLRDKIFLDKIIKKKLKIKK